MGITQGITTDSDEFTILQITADTTLDKFYNRIELDGSSSDVTLTLPDSFSDERTMEIVRIDDFANINNIVKVVAETATNLDEMNQEIVFDIFLGTRVYFASALGKYRSIDGFSQKRIDTLLTRSTGTYINGFTPSTYTSINTTAQTWETININQGGIGWIYDRTNDDYLPRPHKVKWVAQVGVDDTGGVGADGEFITHINTSGVQVTENVSNLIILLTYNGVSAINSNTHIQIAAFTRISNSIISPTAKITNSLNTAKRLDALLDSLGSMNNADNPILTSFNGANLKIDINTGQGISRGQGFADSAGGQGPDIDILETAIVQASILLLDRNGLLISTSTDIDVTQIEDPDNIGTFLTMGNNTAKFNFYKFFVGTSLYVEILGQQTYGTITLAIASGEEPQFPAVLSLAVITQSIAVNKSETDLTANAVLANTARMDLTLI